MQFTENDIVARISRGTQYTTTTLMRRDGRVIKAFRRLTGGIGWYGHITASLERFELSHAYVTNALYLCTDEDGRDYYGIILTGEGHAALRDRGVYHN